MPALFVLLAALASFQVRAKETTAADCTYLLMTLPELRQSLHALIETKPPTQSERTSLAHQIRVAANVLLGQTSMTDADVRLAFDTARGLLSSKVAIQALNPLILGPKPVARFKTEDLGILQQRFPRLKMTAYAIYRGNDLDKPVAYITKIVLDVRPEDEALFQRSFHRRAFLHESISASLKDHRNDLIQIAATVTNSTADNSPGRFTAAMLSPIVTDTFAYAHNEFRSLRREHRSFLSFFEEMKKSPDEIIFEVMHFLGLFTDQADFEN